MDIKVSGRKTTVTMLCVRMWMRRSARRSRFSQHRSPRHDVVLRYEKNPSNPNPAIVEVTVRARGSVIRVAEHGADMYAAIDLSADKVTRQLRKFKTMVDNRQGGASAADVAPVERVEDPADLLPPEEEDDLLVREKVIDVTPMTEEQVALVQTDLLGHGSRERVRERGRIPSHQCGVSP